MGQIVTFYSYKGGVGRSLLLANVGAILAQWGARVLCVDWDLEAPGLDAYFAPYLQHDSRPPGLISLIEALADGTGKPDPARYVSPVALPACSGTLDLLAAGVHETDYFQRVQTLDWTRLYSENDLGNKLEVLREEARAQYDFILVDSRTGFSDTGGICTVQIPDTLVFVFAPNHQNIEGVTGAVERIRESRKNLSVDRAQLTTIPVLSRFDQRTEYQRAQQWLQGNLKALEPFIGSWLERGIPVSTLMEFARVPYFSYWSFGERLPAVEETSATSESISYYFQNIAALVVLDGAGVGQLAEARDSYIARARRSFQQRQHKYDLFLSYSKLDKQYANQLIGTLQKQGINVFSGRLIDHGKDIPPQLNEAIDHAKHMAVIVSGRPSPYQLEHASRFFKQTLESPEESQRNLVTINLTEEPIRESFLANMRSAGDMKGGVQAVASSLIEIVKGPSA